MGQRKGAPIVVGLLSESDAPGGTERLIIQIALELRRRGHPVVTFGPANGPGKGWLGQELRTRGLVWEPIVKRGFTDPRPTMHLLRGLREHKVEVLHSHEFAPTVFGALACWLTGRTHVATMHSDRYFASNWRRRVSFGWAVRHSAAIVAVSRDTRDDAERILGLPPGTIHVITNGVASQAGNRAIVRQELGVRDDELVVVALGNVSPRKAHILILRALVQLRGRRPDLLWRFAIAGTDQGSAAELRAFAAQHGVAAQLHLLGHRSDTEDVLAAADVFAMSSLHEGMPLAIIEAMFAEKPIISSTAGGIAEMIAHDKEGLLVPVGEVESLSAGFEKLFSNADLRAAFGIAARQRAERQFGIGPMMDAYMRLYQKR